jgi:hypothetical protein
MKSECDAVAVANADVDASNRDSTCSHGFVGLVGYSLTSLVNSQRSFQHAGDGGDERSRRGNH